MILKGKEAKERILKGINGISDVVKSTLGYKGKTVLISENLRMGFYVTKDGVTVAKSVTFEDDIENCGADFIKNAAQKTVEEAGDGTTTTTILTQSMCNSVFNELELGANPNKLIKDIQVDLETVKEFIKSNSKVVKTTKDIKNIAKVSSNDDEDISELIKDIYDEAGFNVEIDVVESDNVKSSYEIVNGYTMHDTGYCSNVFINNQEKNRVEFNNPKVFIYNGKIKSMSNSLSSLFEDNADRNSEKFRPLVLIVEDIEEAVLREIIMAFTNQMIFNVAIVQTNLIHEDRKNIFIDASKILNAEYSEDKLGYFGECERIIIEKENVTFINGAGNVTSHIKSLESKIDPKSKNIFLERRLFALKSNAAIIKVGGKLRTEVDEKKDRIDDAVKAVKSSIEEGFSPGGSSIYLFALKECDIKTRIMREALKSCYIQLMRNAEIEPFLYFNDIMKGKVGTGYNLIKEEVSDLYKDGIFDSTKVLRVAMENAVHTTCNFAMINATISK